MVILLIKKSIVILLNMQSDQSDGLLEEWCSFGFFSFLYFASLRMIYLQVLVNLV